MQRGALPSEPAGIFQATKRVGPTKLTPAAGYFSAASLHTPIVHIVYNKEERRQNIGTCWCSHPHISSSNSVFPGSEDSLQKRSRRPKLSEIFLALDTNKPSRKTGLLRGRKRGRDNTNKPVKGSYHCNHHPSSFVPPAVT